MSLQIILHLLSEIHLHLFGSLALDVAPCGSPGEASECSTGQKTPNGDQRSAQKGSTTSGYCRQGQTRTCCECRSTNSCEVKANKRPILLSMTKSYLFRSELPPPIDLQLPPQGLLHIERRVGHIPGRNL